MRRTLATLVLLLTASLASAGSADKRLDLYWIDVEGGAATLLVTPAGEGLLLDTGNLGRRDPERIVKVAGEIAGLKQIEHLVITHYHGDHFGGAITLADLMPIKNLYDNGKFDNMPDDPGRAYFELKAGQKHIVKPGMTLPLKQGNETSPKLSFTFLGGKTQFIEAPAGSP